MSESNIILEVQYRHISEYLRYHFSVTAGCFLGFNLKKRAMAVMVAYVAKTHYRKKNKKT